MTLAITRVDLDAAWLRGAASRREDAAASRRMLALALILEGKTRAEAPRSAGMDLKRPPISRTRSTARKGQEQDRGYDRSFRKDRGHPLGAAAAALEPRREYAHGGGDEPAGCHISNCS